MKKIIILLTLFVLVACKSSKHNTNCDAYGSVSKTTQK